MNLLFYGAIIIKKNPVGLLFWTLIPHILFRMDDMQIEISMIATGILYISEICEISSTIISYYTTLKVDI